MIGNVANDQQSKLHSTELPSVVGSRENILSYESYYNISVAPGSPELELDAISVMSQKYLENTEKMILRPYSRILKALGMRALGYPDVLLHRVLSALWVGVVFGLILTGYSINIYLCQSNKLDMEDPAHFKNVCTNHSLTYHYVKGLCDSTFESVLPSAIHFVAFIYSFWIFRIAQSEQVEALVQKAFTIVNACTNSEMRRTRFIKRLKIVYFGGYIFLLLIFVLTAVNSYFGKSLLLWKCKVDDSANSMVIPGHYYNGTLYAIPMCLIYALLVPILLNFVIQSRLICFLVLELRETLREKRNTLKAMMQEAHDISTFLHKMNKEASPAMSFILFYVAYGLFIDAYTILETMYDAKSLSDIFSTRACSAAAFDRSTEKTCIDIKKYGLISFISVTVRLAALFGMLFYTIYEGCSIATSYKRLVNQALETRVFGFQDNTTVELDSFQVYLSALRMRAKLFQYPMETKRLLLPLVLFIFLLLCLDISYSIVG